MRKGREEGVRGGKGQRREGGGIGIDNAIEGVWKEIERKGAGDYYEGK